MKRILAVVLCMLCASTALADMDVPEYFLSDPFINQLLIIRITERSSGTASFYVRNEDNTAWQQVFESGVYTGRNGGGKTREGDGKTPLGEYHVTSAFGIMPNPGTTIPYIDVTPTTYACDENCKYYNQIIDADKTRHPCSGEIMYRCRPYYNWGMVIDYNPSNTYPNGSAIFLHCKGSKTSTGGCVAFDEEDMITLLLMGEKGMAVYITEE